MLNQKHSHTMQPMNEASQPLWHFWQPRFWPLWAGLGLLRIIVLFPQKLRMKVGSLLGKLAYLLAGERAIVAQRNIELCFPNLSPVEQLMLTHKHFESLGKLAIEMGMGWWISDKEAEELFVIEGIENLKEAIRREKGILLLCGHFAGVELSGRALKNKLPQMAAMYRPNKNALLNAFMLRSRAASTEELITKDNVRQLLRALKQQKAVWYAPDQAYTGKNAVLVNFCGVPAMSNPATTQLVKASKASLLPFLPSRLPDDSGYKLQFLPIVDDIPSEDPVDDTIKINAVFERHIRNFPEQYYWVHRRFKGRPSNLGDAYGKTKAD